MIHVIATIELVEGARDAFLNEFRALVPKVLRGSGLPGVRSHHRRGQWHCCAASDLRERRDGRRKMERPGGLEMRHLRRHTWRLPARVKSLVRSTTLQVLEPA